MWLGVAWWQCHGWAKHIALSMSTRASVATWIYAGAFEPGNFFWTCLYDCLQTFGTSQFRRKTPPYTMAMGSQLRTQKRDGLPPEKNIAKIWSGIHPKLCLVSQTTAARVDHDLWKGQWTSCPWGNRFKGGKEVHEFLAVNMFILQYIVVALFWKGVHHNMYSVDAEAAPTDYGDSTSCVQGAQTCPFWSIPIFLATNSS